MIPAGTVLAIRVPYVIDRPQVWADAVLGVLAESHLSAVMSTAQLVGYAIHRPAKHGRPYSTESLHGTFNLVELLAVDRQTPTRTTLWDLTGGGGTKRLCPRGWGRAVTETLLRSQHDRMRRIVTDVFPGGWEYR